MNIFNITELEGRKILEDAGILEFLMSGDSDEIPPKWDDIARLYILIRERKPFHILEFGSGFSTIVMANALKLNWEDYLNIIDIPKYGQPVITSVESSEKWLKNTKNKVDKIELSEYCEIVYSNVKISEYRDEICHFYCTLPDVVPDFVYIDGPARSTVQGNINGISFSNPKRTVMSADILKYESTLLPGFFMIIDGRTNNARFLKRMLRRSYNVTYHEKADVTTFEMSETRLGIKNIFGSEAYSCSDVYFAGKKIS